MSLEQGIERGALFAIEFLRSARRGGYLVDLKPEVLEELLVQCGATVDAIALMRKRHERALERGSPKLAIVAGDAGRSC
jgi:hypothetical protein